MSSSVLDKPGIYLTASFAAGLASFWHVINQVGPSTGFLEALQQYPLASAGFFNTILAMILLVYYGLNILFFGLNPSPGEHAIIVDKLCNFFLFKIVLIGLVLAPDMIDTGVWIIWCASLAAVKAIVQFGILRLEYYEANQDTRNVPGFQRALLHLCFVALYMICSLVVWRNIIKTGSETPLALWLLVLFDLVTTLIEWTHSCLLYGMHVVKDSTIFSRFSFSYPEDQEEFTYSVDLGTDFLTLLVTLFHFLHVYTISGISLSLVDILLLLNIRTTGIQLVKKVRDAYIFRMLRISIDEIFPSGDRDRETDDKKQKNNNSDDKNSSNNNNSDDKNSNNNNNSDDKNSNNNNNNNSSDDKNSNNNNNNSDDKNSSNNNNNSSSGMSSQEHTTVAPCDSTSSTGIGHDDNTTITPTTAPTTTETTAAAGNIPPAPASSGSNDSSSSPGAPDDMCSICLDDMDQGVKRLPCGHRIHAKCLRTLVFKGSKFTFQRAVTTARQTTLPLYTNTPLATTAADVLNIANATAAQNHGAAGGGGEGVAGGVQVAADNHSGGHRHRHHHRNNTAAAAAGRGNAGAGGRGRGRGGWGMFAATSDGFRDNVSALLSVFFVSPPYSNARMEDRSRSFVAQLMQNIGCNSFKCPLCRSDVDPITGQLLLVKSDQSSSSTASSQRPTAAAAATGGGGDPRATSQQEAAAISSTASSSSFTSDSHVSARLEQRRPRPDLTLRGIGRRRRGGSRPNDHPEIIGTSSDSSDNSDYDSPELSSSLAFQEFLACDHLTPPPSPRQLRSRQKEWQHHQRQQWQQRADHILESYVDMYPNLTHEDVLQDLCRTSYAEHTIDNIIHGRGRFHAAARSNVAAGGGASDSDSGKVGGSGRQDIPSASTAGTGDGADALEANGATSNNRHLGEEEQQQNVPGEKQSGREELRNVPGNVPGNLDLAEKRRKFLDLLEKKGPQSS